MFTVNEFVKLALTAGDIKELTVNSCDGQATFTDGITLSYDGEFLEILLPQKPEDGDYQEKYLSGIPWQEKATILPLIQKLRRKLDNFSEKFVKAVKENLENPDRVPTYPVWIIDDPFPIWVSADKDDPRHGDTLCFDPDQKTRLATRDEYEGGSRDVGSIFEALNPGDCIRLKEGKYRIDENLDIKSKFSMIELTVKEVIESAWREQPLAELFTESSPEIWSDRAPIGYTIMSSSNSEKIVFDVEFA